MKVMTAVGECFRQAAKLATPAGHQARHCSHTHQSNHLQQTRSMTFAAPYRGSANSIERSVWHSPGLAWPALWAQARRATTIPDAQPETAPQEEAAPGLPTVVVFGGNGFVGSRVCEEAVRTGLPVVSISRSGAPKLNAAWTSEVEWVQADVFNPQQWRHKLKGAIGVMSCLGAFGTNEFMYKMCGESNISIFNEAAAAGVPRAAFLSVHDYNVPSFVLSGYFQGKRDAERTLAAKFPDSGVAIRPSFIHGSRQVGSVSVPLSAIGIPLDKTLSLLPAKSLASWPVLGLGLTPPVSVQAVAKAAVAAVTDPSIPAGVLDMWTIKERFEN